jgi:hypothetical protein
MLSQILLMERHMADRSDPWQWIRVLALTAQLLILPLCAAGVFASDVQVPEPASTASPVGSNTVETADSGQSEDSTASGTTVDKTHYGLEQNILEQVIRFDNFFGNVKTEDQQKTEYQLRWRSSLRLGQKGQVKLGTTLRANLKLSKINERLRLVVSGENEPDPLSPSLPQDSGSPGFDRSSPTTTRIVNTELRYDLLKTPDLDIFLGAGFLFKILPESFVRSRFQYTYKFSDISLLRFSETLFVKKLEGVGETTEIDLERLLDNKTLLRWSNAGTVSYEIKGLEWGSELSLIRELSTRSAITLAGGVFGNTSIDGEAGNYRMLARYRRNFLKSWLFYELEPEISWPRQTGGSFPTTLAFTFRIEVVFQGKEKR